MSFHSDTPELVRVIGQACGYEAAVAIVRKWGGVRLFIPQAVTADHVLAKTIGLDAAAKLVELLGHGHVEVPMWTAATAALKTRLVLSLAAEGLSRREIALAAKCSGRRVYQILAEADAGSIDPHQLDMFAAE
jgi:hypothetical protein